jgi:hypothetical protein
MWCFEMMGPLFAADYGDTLVLQQLVGAVLLLLLLLLCKDVACCKKWLVQHGRCVNTLVNDL